jgi:hypothetical protein
VKLAGILYLHPINRPRINGPAREALKNPTVFANLCGAERMPNIILVTTFWEGVEGNDGARRETELKEAFREQLLPAEAECFRSDSPESPGVIVEHLLSKKPLRFKPKGTHTV